MPKKSHQRMLLKQFFICPSLSEKLRDYADFHCMSVSQVIRVSIENLILQSEWARDAVQIEVSK